MLGHSDMMRLIDQARSRVAFAGLWKIRIARRRGGAGLAVFSLGLLLSGPADLQAASVAHLQRAAKNLTPYRAVYELSLREAGSKSSISAIEGRMVIDFAGSECEGYTQNSRFVTRISSTRGRVNVFDSRVSSWESGDGAAYRFTNREYFNKALKQDYAGRAERGGEGGAGLVAMESPEKSRRALPGGTIFPTEHMRRLLAAAYGGENLLSARVFDGAYGANWMVISAFIGARNEKGKVPPPAGVKGAEALKNMESWPVTISYFTEKNSQSGEQAPDHAMRVTMYENGVGTNIVMTFSNFALNARLSDLKLLEKPACE